MALVILALFALTVGCVSASDDINITDSLSSDDIDISDVTTQIETKDNSNQDDNVLQASDENEILKGEMGISVVGGQKESYNVGETVYLKMGTEKSSYTPATIYVQVEGGGYYDNEVGTYTQATSDEGVPYTFDAAGTINLRLIQNYYGTSFFSDYLSFNVVEAGPSIPQGSFTELQSMIDGATDILDLPYDFAYNPDCDSSLVAGVLVSKSITINGNGHTISGEDLAKIFDVWKADVIITNVTLKNGKSNEGGAIIVSNSITSLLLKDSIIMDSSSNQGGAIHVMSGTLNVENTSFVNNTAQSGGAIYHNSASTLTVTDSTFEDNKATGSYTSGGGAAINMNNGKLIVGNTDFNENVAASTGAAINSVNFATEITVITSRFNKNQASDGAGIYVKSATALTLSDSNFTENTVSGEGGAVYIQHQNANVEISDVEFTKNTARNGGALVSKLATTDVEDSTFADNTATNQAGAIYTSGSVSVTCSTFTNNGDEPFYQAAANTLNVETSTMTAEVTEFNVNETYALDSEITVDGTFITDFNDAVSVTYVLDETENTVDVSGNAFTINLGNALPAGDHTITIKSFADDKGNTYLADAEGQFNIPAPVKGSYSELQYLINKAEDTLELDYDFAYNPECDSELVDGVVIEKTITINGNGHTISGENAAKIFDVYNADVVIENITLANANSRDGGAIIVSNSLTSLTIKDSVIKDSQSNQGGAIHVSGGTVTVENVEFINNTANSGGAVYYNAMSTLTVRDSLFSENKATSTGTAGGGAAININNGKLIVDNTDFADNSAVSTGGAINSVNFATEITVISSRFNKNTAESGAGLYVKSPATVTISDTNFTENTASNEAGAVLIQRNGGILNINDVEFTNNTAKNGGALVSKLATTTVEGATFADNTATNQGGAIFASGNFKVSESSFTGNDANVADNIYQTGENVVTLENNEFIIEEVSLDVGESYDLGDDVKATGTFDSGIYNKAFTLKYTVNGEEQTLTIAKNKNAFTIDFGSELEAGKYAIAIKSFADDAGNTYACDVEKEFIVIAPGSFADLKRQIDNADTTLDLTMDYAFNPACDEDFKDGVLVNKSLTINGNGHTISGENQAKIFDVYKADVVIENITLTNANSRDGGAIVVSNAITSLTIKDSVIKDSQSNQGGAIHAAGGTVTVENTEFVNNSAKSGGTIYFNSMSKLTVKDSTFKDNDATSTGTAGGGGAITVNNGKIVVDNTEFTGNDAVSTGGAINVVNFASELTITDSKFDANTAKEGGAIYIKSKPKVDIKDTNFTENEASNEGGAIFIQHKDADVDIENAVFEDNSAKNGGAIASKLATVDVEKSTFTNNIADNQGGAVYASGNVKLNASTFEDNSAAKGNIAYSITDSAVTVENAIINVPAPELDVEDEYENGAPVVIEGTFESGVNGKEFTLPYTINSEDATVTIPKDKNAFTIDFGSELPYGDYTIAINSFKDDAGNTYVFDPVEVTFTVNREVKTAEDLQKLIDEAEPGSVIELGNYSYENISNVNITKNVTIVGSKDTTISSAGDGNPIFNVPAKSDNGTDAFTITNVTFIVQNGDTIVKLNSDNSTDGTIDNAEINIINNTVKKADEDVVGKSVTVLELDSESTSLAPTNPINISGNTLDDDIKAFQFEITSLSNGSDFNIPSIYDKKDNGTNGSDSNATSKIPTSIATPNKTTTAIDVKVDGKKGVYYQLTLKDKDGKAVEGESVMVILDNVVYTLKTDANGIAKVQLNIKKAGTYTLFAAFLGDDKYNSSFSSAKIKVNKQKIKVKVSKKKFKRSAKKKILKVTLKTSKGKAIKSKKITFKLKGKTYKAKTNKKGVAKIKIKLKKKGTFKGKLTVPTDNTYKKLTKKIKIKIK